MKIISASAALSLSNVPWNGPVGENACLTLIITITNVIIPSVGSVIILQLIITGAVQVGLIGDKVLINPTKEMLEESQLNMVVTATDENKIGE